MEKRLFIWIREEFWRMYSKQKIKNRNICIFLTMRREIRLEIKISKRESKVRERSSNISWHWTIYPRGDIFSIEPNYMLRRIKLFFLYVYHVNSVSPSTTDPRFIQREWIILLTYDCHRSKGRKKYLSIVRSKTSVCLLINGSFSTLPTCFIRGSDRSTHHIARFSYRLIVIYPRFEITID